ncbi:hypothetical protein GJ496_011837 [Pomphorhynchus laevis]|nr:hypothetical protein GJ496_011837 [Pomphorhynchus laevis]
MLAGEADNVVFANRQQSIMLNCTINLLHTNTSEQLWVQLDRQEVLAMDELIIKPDIRLKVYNLASPTNPYNFTSVLQINNVTDMDEGLYGCWIGNTRIKTFKLEIAQPPELQCLFINESRIQFIEKSNVSLKCISKGGQPQPNTYWMKSNADTPYYHESGLLNLSEIRRNHSGLWKCRAQNIAGYSECHIIIDVAYPPNINLLVEKLMDQKRIHVQCKINSKPIININKDIYWYWNDELTTNWMNRAIIINSKSRANPFEVTSSLMIEDTEFDSNVITYITCATKNVHGNSSQRVAITAANAPLKLLHKAQNMRMSVYNRNRLITDHKKNRQALKTLMHAEGFTSNRNSQIEIYSSNIISSSSAISSYKFIYFSLYVLFIHL